MGNSAFGARMGEGKSLPRGEGFRVRVTCVGLAVFERVIALNKFDNVQNRIIINWNMFTVISFMLGGVVIGALLRKRDCSWTSKAITVLIWLLLFLLGVEVGGNKKIIAALPVLGLDAMAISVASILGSCVCAWLLWRYIQKRRKA